MEILEMINKYGISTGILLIIFTGSVSIILLIIKTYITNDIKNEFTKSSEILKGNIQSELELFKKKLDIPFLNEPIRVGLSTHIGKKIFDDTVEIYIEIYKLFFEVTYSLADLSNGKVSKPDEKFIELYQLLTEARKKCFLSAIYAPRLTDFLLNAVIALKNDTDEVQTKLRGYNVSHGPYRSSKLDASTELGNARKWLYENMLSSITIKDLTFNPEDLSIVERMAKNAKDSESEQSKTK